MRKQVVKGHQLQVLSLCLTVVKCFTNLNKFLTSDDSLVKSFATIVWPHVFLVQKEEKPC